MKVVDFRQHEPPLKMRDHLVAGSDHCYREAQGYSCTRPYGHSGACEAGTSSGAAASWSYE